MSSRRCERCNYFLRADDGCTYCENAIPLERRFWTLVDTGCAGECWEWTGSKDRYGYGEIRPRVAGRRQFIRATHLALLLKKGLVVPHGLEVLHSCDNPPCVNPDHLRIDSHAANVDDCLSKGRLVRHATGKFMSPAAAGHPVKAHPNEPRPVAV